MESIQIIERAVGISYDGEWFRLKSNIAKKDICILPKGEQNFGQGGDYLSSYSTASTFSDP